MKRYFPLVILTGIFVVSLAYAQDSGGRKPVDIFNNFAKIAGITVGCVILFKIIFRRRK